MRDLRRYARQTNRALVVGGIFLIIIIALALIYIFYGPEATLLGLVCMVGALSPVVLIFLIIQGMEWWVKWLDRRDGNG